MKPDVDVTPNIIERIDDYQYNDKLTKHFGCSSLSDTTEMTDFLVYAWGLGSHS